MKGRVVIGVLTVLLSAHSFAQNSEVNITHDVPSIEVTHEGHTVVIQRNQDTENMVDFDFSLTSRPCPPFCVQPISLGHGVETLGELELLEYLRQANQDNAILVIDSRTQTWTEKGIIPGAVIIPWTHLHPTHSEPADVAELMQLRFNVAKNGLLLDFSQAKTLAFYCNGPWCGQSPSSIKALLAYGYPAEKIKWYRGGMQSWKMLGLTTVEPDRK